MFNSKRIAKLEKQVKDVRERLKTENTYVSMTGILQFTTIGIEPDIQKLQTENKELRAEIAKLKEIVREVVDHVYKEET